MFGQSSWFREKEMGWGLVPVTWQGWVYVVLWCAVLTGPFVLLLADEKPWEATIWLLLAVAVLLFDVWVIVAAIHAEKAQAENAASETPRATQLAGVIGEPSHKYDLYAK